MGRVLFKSKNVRAVANSVSVFQCFQCYRSEFKRSMNTPLHLVIKKGEIQYNAFNLRQQRSSRSELT